MHTKLYDPVTGEIYISVYNIDLALTCGFSPFWNWLRREGYINSFFKVPTGCAADELQGEVDYHNMRSFTQKLLDFSKAEHGGLFYLGESNYGEHVGFSRIPERTKPGNYSIAGRLFYCSLLRQPESQSVFQNLHDYDV